MLPCLLLIVVLFAGERERERDARGCELGGCDTRGREREGYLGIEWSRGGLMLKIRGVVGSRRSFEHCLRVVDHFRLLCLF